MHGLQCFGQYSTEGHLSAYGMPDRPCVIRAACGFTRQDIRSRLRSPSWCPLSGDWGLVAKVRSLPSARGPGIAVEVAAAPGAWRGVGKCAGGNAGPIVSEKSASATRQQEQRCRSVVCRFLDALDKDVGGVSPAQHQAVVRCWPTVKCAALRHRNSTATSALACSERPLPCVPARGPGPSSIVFSPAGRGFAAPKPCRSLG
jgi:hypothetical protein